MASERAKGHPAAGIPPGRNRRRYRGSPRPRDLYKDGPDAIPVRHVAKVAAPEKPDPWTAHAREAAFRVTDFEVDAVRVEVLGSTEPRRKLLDIRLEYVGAIADARPWLSVVARGPRLLERLAAAPLPWDKVLAAPWRLPLRPAAEAGAPCVLVWRDPGTPIECGFLAVEIVRDALGVGDPARVRVRRDEADGPTIVERTRLAGVRAKRESRYKQVLASCSKCGRDLRDPVYAEVGIGPECIKSYPAEQVRLRRQINRTLGAGRPIHLNAKPGERWLSTVVRHWQLGAASA
ncbi:hypothetical protein AAur_pTC10090 (plasmid) [Paenarthrobacter aurescens TC1]|jgi:hypothetical protein|uniref:Uncharacterized protein n=3 Tax=Paenarthrobacter aurescens TaxID=43663 RepID=Q6SJZ3_PAEAU|nr:hypothetical protein [Paenarthrobacter aurescens]ABM10328.1 hypothetical protein AAur_pTC10090 [Paenarthrobacter aurescens TC1]